MRAMERSNLDNLGSFHQRIAFGYGYPACGFVVVGAVVPIRVPMRGAEDIATLAPEAEEPDTLPARVASVCRFWGTGGV